MQLALVFLWPINIIERVFKLGLGPMDRQTDISRAMTATSSQSLLSRSFSQTINPCLPLLLPKQSSDFEPPQSIKKRPSETKRSLKDSSPEFCPHLLPKQERKRKLRSMAGYQLGPELSSGDCKNHISESVMESNTSRPLIGHF